MSRDDRIEALERRLGDAERRSVEASERAARLEASAAWLMAERDWERTVTRWLVGERDARIVELVELVEALAREGKRQAAPFSKGKKGGSSKKPGRKGGASYGRKARRLPPENIDEVYDVGLPKACPECGSDDLVEDKKLSQYQQEIVAFVLNRRFDVSVGRCGGCGARVQGRHALQTSDTLGAAGVMLGPRAIAWIAVLQKQFGLSHGKVARVMGRLFGLQITPSGVTHALARLAKRGRATYERLVESVRASDAVTGDETGWRIDGLTAWLWAFVTFQVAVFAIRPGRSYKDAQTVLPAGWAGILIRDGWAVYRCFKAARHQTCLAHLLRRTRDMVRADRYHHSLPEAVAALLRDMLWLRDQRKHGLIGVGAWGAAYQNIIDRLDALLATLPRTDAERRLLKHLRVEHEHGALFTFLDEPGIDATNWRAEQAIRPAVVNRKTCGGGNRTNNGARTQEILTSLITTACLQGKDPAIVLADLQHHNPNSPLATLIPT